MRHALVLPVVLALAVVSQIHSTAHAGAFGKLDFGGSSGDRNPDCGHLLEIDQTFPDWSRFSWSWSLGSSSRYDHMAWQTSAALVAQVSWQFLAVEKQCRSGSGWFASSLWRRVSLAWSLDAAYRTAMESAPLDLRPGLRLARSTYDVGLLTVGSHYVPSFELALTVGPTFSPGSSNAAGFSGAAVSFQGRFSIFTGEVRTAWRSETNGAELMFLIGLTDLHGLAKIGPKREAI